MQTLAYRTALSTIESQLRLGGVGRISLHALNPVDSTFTVLDSVGADLLAPGSKLPIPAATQIMLPARGEIFSGNELEYDPSFDHELDRLITQMGFHSSCSVPLMLGRSPVGVLCVSSRERSLERADVLGSLDTVGPELTLALCTNSQATTSPLAVVCYQDLILSDWINRVLEEEFGLRSMLFESESEAIAFAAEHASQVRLVVCESYFAGGALDGLLGRMRACQVGAPMLVVASCDSPLSLELARRSGADGYAARKDGLAGVVAAVRSLRTGQPSSLDRPADGEDSTRLTKQECALLLHLEQGKTFSQIARDMSISVATAKGYARNLFTKFQAHSRTEAVFEARRQGVIDFLRNGGNSTLVTAARNDHRPG